MNCIKIIFSFSLLCIFGCTNPSIDPNQADSKTIDFGTFTIEVPLSWKKINSQGVDSYVGRIAIDAYDTVHFDLGQYSNNLHEYDPMVLDSSILNDFDTSNRDMSEYIIVKNRFNVDLDKYRKTDFSWDTIDNRRVKLVFPRKSGIGITGIYIDSLSLSPTGLIRFNFYGNNLSHENEIAFLKALRTLKFKLEKH